jgi:hypothetical protein
VIDGISFIFNRLSLVKKISAEKFNDVASCIESGVLKLYFALTSAALTAISVSKLNIVIELE